MKHSNLILRTCKCGCVWIGSVIYSTTESKDIMEFVQFMRQCGKMSGHGARDYEAIGG